MNRAAVSMGEQVSPKSGMAKSCHRSVFKWDLKNLKVSVFGDRISSILVWLQGFVSDSDLLASGEPKPQATGLQHRVCLFSDLDCPLPWGPVVASVWVPCELRVT